MTQLSISAAWYPLGAFIVLALVIFSIFMLNHLPSEFSINLIQPKRKSNTTTFTLGTPKTSTDQNKFAIRPSVVTLHPNIFGQPLRKSRKMTSEGKEDDVAEALSSHNLFSRFLRRPNKDPSTEAVLATAQESQAKPAFVRNVPDPSFSVSTRISGAGIVPAQVVGPPGP